MSATLLIVEGYTTAFWGIANSIAEQMGEDVGDILPIEVCRHLRSVDGECYASLLGALHLVHDAFAELCYLGVLSLNSLFLSCLNE